MARILDNGFNGRRIHQIIPPGVRQRYFLPAVYEKQQELDRGTGGRLHHPAVETEQILRRHAISPFSLPAGAMRYEAMIA
jgi:hypothetical protein